MVQFRVKRERVHLLILVLTCCGCVQPLVAVMVHWWSVTQHVAGTEVAPGYTSTFYYGTLLSEKCYTAFGPSGLKDIGVAGGEGEIGDGGGGNSGNDDDEDDENVGLKFKDYCLTSRGFTFLPGEEAYSVSQLFALFTTTLCAVTLLTLTLHTFLEGTLILLTASAFQLGAAGVFGFLSVIVFLGFYNEMKTSQHSIGPAFYLVLMGSCFCLPAGGLSAWAAVKGGYSWWISSQEPGGEIEITHGMKDAACSRQGSRDLLDYGEMKVASQEEQGTATAAAQVMLEPPSSMFDSKENLIDGKR